MIRPLDSTLSLLSFSFCLKARWCLLITAPYLSIWLKILVAGILFCILYFGIILKSTIARLHWLCIKISTICLQVPVTGTLPDGSRKAHSEVPPPGRQTWCKNKWLGKHQYSFFNDCHCINTSYNELDGAVLCSHVFVLKGH